MKVADTFENRAEFLIGLYGGDPKEVKAKFPEWYAQRVKLKYGSTDELLWFTNFAKRAFELRTLVTTPNGPQAELEALRAENAALREGIKTLADNPPNCLGMTYDAGLRLYRDRLQALLDIGGK